MRAAHTRNRIPEPKMNVLRRQLRQQRTGADRDDALDRQRERRAEEHGKRAVAGREDQRRQRRLVRQLGNEDHAEHAGKQAQ